MITREQIPTVLDHPVHDAGGNKIGDAKHVFLDDVTGEPEWVTVKTGHFGTSESFVPIHDASLVKDHLEVPYPKDTVKDAPNVDVDVGGHLSEEEEHRLYEHYGIDWNPAWQQQTAQTGTGRETRTADDAMTRSEEQMHVGTERYEAGAGPGCASTSSPRKSSRPSSYAAKRSASNGNPSPRPTATTP